MAIVKDVVAAISNAFKVKLKGGFTSNALTFTIVIVGFLTALCALLAVCQIRDVLVLVILGIFTFLFYVLRLVSEYAKQYPDAALLEGAEFVKLQQIKMAQKYEPEKVVNPQDVISLEDVKRQETLKQSEDIIHISTASAGDTNNEQS